MTDDPIPQPPDDERLLHAVLEELLTTHNLHDAFATPFAPSDDVPFAQQLAQKLAVDLQDQQALKSVLDTRLAAFLESQAISLGQEDREQLRERLHAELFGASILEPLLQDPQVSEIMVNGPGQVFAERRGRLEQQPKTFSDSTHVMRVIQRLLPPGEQLDYAKAHTQLLLPDGARMTVVLPPLALNGPCLTIRKFRREQLTVDDLIRFGSLTREMAELLMACVRARWDIIVAGGTGSGRTTLLNIITGFIPEDERIVTVEELAELQVRHNHVVSLQSRLPNSRGEGGVTVRDLLRTAALMRPDRFILGELQGAEVFELLQGISRGHNGSMMALFATTPTQAMEQIEMQIKFNQPDLPVSYLRSLMGFAINLVVQQNRLRDGSRKVTHITEVLPDREQGYQLRDIITFKTTGQNERGKLVGEHVQVNSISPELKERLDAMRIVLPPSIRV